MSVKKYVTGLSPLQNELLGRLVRHGGLSIRKNGTCRFFGVEHDHYKVPNARTLDRMVSMGYLKELPIGEDGSKEIRRLASTRKAYDDNKEVVSGWFSPFVGVE